MGVLIGVLVHSDILEGYLDESGTHRGSPIVCSGGYLFEPDGAADFRKVWEPYLKSKDLEFFHANECLNRSDWEEIFDELVELIKKTAHIGFVKSVQNDTLGLLDLRVKQFAGSPYTMCTLGCMELMSLIAKEENKRILYFVEEGNEFAAELRHFFNLIKNSPKLMDDFVMAGADTYSKKDVIQLQAADLLAWEFRRSFYRDRWTKSILSLTRALRHQFHGFSAQGANIRALMNSAQGIQSNQRKFQSH